MNKLKFAIGVLSMALLLLMVACVKDVTDQQAQFQAEKAELLKAKAEMTTSFKAMADATRAVSKKNFSPSNRGVRFDEQTLVNDLTQELVRQNPAIKADTKIRLNKVWNPKTEKLGDYLAANGASENVISYSNTLKTNLESASAKFSDDVKSGQLDTKEMLASVSQVFQDMEQKVINDRKLTQTEKLTLLASTTAGIELTPAWVEMYQDHHNMLISSRWSWRAIANAIINIAVVVAVVTIAVLIIGAIVAAAVAAGATAVFVAGIAADASIILAGMNTLFAVIFDCRGFCVFEDDGCYCNQ